MKDQNLIVPYLRDEKMLDESALEELINECQSTGRNIIKALKADEMLNTNQMARVVAFDNDIEFIDLSLDMIDDIAAKLVSYDIAKEHNLIPVRFDGGKLYVAMSAPLNLSVRDIIATRSGYKVVPLAAAPESIREAVSHYFTVESTTKQDIVAMRMKESSGSKGGDRKLKMSKKTDDPIVRLVDSIITGGVNARCSDIHIEPSFPDMRIRYRVDGILIDALQVPGAAEREVISHIKVLADMDISERRLPQDGHIVLEHHGKDYDLRVSSLPATSGEKIVIRVLDTTEGLMGLERIVNDPRESDKFNSLISNPYGIILLTGPTGSGKTTTLYSMINALNTPTRNIVTVEDPVEYRVAGITQVQVNSDTGMTFASSLRSILRQDPDVILIGEIRDYETAEIAISAAQTGHLVLSTLHTNDAAGAITRLVNLGIPAYQVGSTLLGTVAQRLVRSICPKCKTAYEPSAEELSCISVEGIQDSKVELFKGAGCDACHLSGYRGRRGVYEILEMTPGIRDMLIDGESGSRIKGKAVSEGMKTLKMQGLSLAMSGLTTMDELFRVIDMREE